MQTCDTLLHAGVLLTQDDDRRVLENAALAIDGGRIVAEATPEELVRIGTHTGKALGPVLSR